jgi:hypothetical protein
MRELKKRWEHMKITAAVGKFYRTFLSAAKTKDDPEPLAWACIETTGPALEAPYHLEIWNGTEGEWEHITTFNTLKEAKAVGRVMASIALNKNF